MKNQSLVMSLGEFHAGALCEPKTQSLGMITTNGNLAAIF